MISFLRFTRKLSNFAGTSLSCAGIQRWKSVSFHCWTAINLVGELRRRRRTPTPPHPHSELWRVLHSCFPSSQWAVKSSTFLLSFLTVSCGEFCILAFLPHSELWRVLHSCFPSSQWAVKSSTFLLALCLLWAGVVKHYTAVPSYWYPRG